jgi:MSHA biogenesis protein MshJ
VNAAEQLNNLRDRVNAMSLRERLLVLGLVVAALLIGWQSLLMDPLERRRGTAIAELDGMRQRLAALEQGQSAAGDPLSEALTREKSLQAETARLEAELAATAAALVPPDRMADLLRSLLERQRGLRLVSLEKLPAEATGPAGGGGSQGPYVQPIAIEVEGNYGAIVDYLRDVEGLELRFLWRSLDVATGDWPVNRARIELGTLSLGREWLRT